MKEQRRGRSQDARSAAQVIPPQGGTRDAVETAIDFAKKSPPTETWEKGLRTARTSKWSARKIA